MAKPRLVFTNGSWLAYCTDTSVCAVNSDPQRAAQALGLVVREQYPGLEEGKRAKADLAVALRTIRYLEDSVQSFKDTLEGYVHRMQVLDREYDQLAQEVILHGMEG